MMTRRIPMRLSSAACFWPLEIALLVATGCSGDQAWDAVQEISVTWPEETTGESESDSSTSATDTEPASTTTTGGPGGSESDSESGSEGTTSSSSTTEGVTTTDDPGVCGDGMVGGDEECDDGNADNTDDCLNSCMEPYCGDGLVAKDEECDDGNTDDDDGCNTACARDRLVFVTSKFYQGDLGTVSGADQACRGLASLAGLEKSDEYRAWISGPGHSPDTQFYKSKGRYVLPTGDSVANNWEDLTDGDLSAPINVDEQMVLQDVPVWTNTSITGELHVDSQDCGNWFEKDPEFKGRFGLSNEADESWTDYDGDPVVCGAYAHLYCFEQE